MKRGSKKRGREEKKKERKAIAFGQEQKRTHTSPWTEYLVDVKEIFSCSIVVWPRIN